MYEVKGSKPRGPKRTWKEMVQKKLSST